MAGAKSPEVDRYIEGFEPGVRAKLTQMRELIAGAAPDASEKMSYAMPTFYLSGNLVHFAAFDRHIGFYPTPSAVAHFNDELTGYRTSKGAVQFPMTDPLPAELITRMVAFRVAEVTAS